MLGIHNEAYCITRQLLTRTNGASLPGFHCTAKSTSCQFLYSAFGRIHQLVLVFNIEIRATSMSGRQIQPLVQYTGFVRASWQAVQCLLILMTNRYVIPYLPPCSSYIIWYYASSIMWIPLPKLKGGSFVLFPVIRRLINLHSHKVKTRMVDVARNLEPPSRPALETAVTVSVCLSRRTPGK